MITIRDFIYLDIERLKSLYSQVFQGVVDTIIETGMSEHESANTQKGGIKHGGGTVAERVAEASYKTESRVLFDHMYNLLEDKLGGTVVSVSDLTRESYVSALGQAFMVKVRGQAEIADFQRIRTVFDKFNDISHALNYMSTFPQRQSAQDGIAKLTDQIAAETDRNRKTQLKTVLHQKKKEYELPPGTQIDTEFLKSVSFITEMFSSDRYEIAISPDADSEILFRSILDKRWLRVSPEFLLALYGGYPAPNWTMVGHVTYLPKIRDGSTDDNEEMPQEESGDTANSNSSKSPSTMRDAYRNLMGAYQGVERTFTDSEELIEIVTWPLAIYRESVVPELGEVTNG